jgi:Fe-S cluster assembly protein SufD
MMAVALLEELGGGDVRLREESWRYSKTALKALSQQDFVAANTQSEVSSAVRAQFDWTYTQGKRAVFVNGMFAVEHSDLTEVSSVVTLTPTAGGGTLLTIAAGSAISALHLVYLNLPSAAPSRWQTGCAIEVQEGARVDLIEQHVGDAGADVFGVLSSQISIASGARLATVTMSDLPDSISLLRRVHASIASDASCRSTHAIFGGRLQRFELGTELNGARAQFVSRGVFALRARQHADIHMDTRHAARDTGCDIVWRGVADQRARGIFHGAIVVAAGADGADAKLSNKNLLLSAQAEIDTQPVLEIYADEVKAAHGATVGQLDERTLFYLRSRGIPLADARTLLISAFCKVALDDVAGEALRAQIEQRLERVLPDAAE